MMRVENKNIAQFPRRIPLTTFDKSILAETVAYGDRQKWRRENHKMPFPVAIRDPHFMVSTKFMEEVLPGAFSMKCKACQKGKPNYSVVAKIGTCSSYFKVECTQCKATVNDEPKKLMTTSLSVI